MKTHKNSFIQPFFFHQESLQLFDFAIAAFVF